MSISPIDAVGSIGSALSAFGATSTPATDVTGAAGAATTAGTAGVAGTSGVTGPTGPAATTSASGVDFGNLVLDGLDRLQGLQSTSDSLAVKAATGDLSAIHDYTIAATEASTATQLAVSLRNQAIGAFTEIMHMQV